MPQGSLNAALTAPRTYAGAVSEPLPLSAVAASWDAEYVAGRYAGAPPDGFVSDIIAAAAAHRLRQGLYIGCGNGRNLVPLLAAGLDLTGLDISQEAIRQLRAQRPDRAGRFIVGDLSPGLAPLDASPAAVGR